MNRYHNKVYFPAEDKKALQDFTLSLNSKAWQYSAHCLDNIVHRAIDIEGVLSYIKAQELCFNSIFEYYKEGNIIIKVCYRVKYTADIDIILVLSADKKIITIYMNSAEDNHFTLKKELYCRP